MVQAKIPRSSSLSLKGTTKVTLNVMDTTKIAANRQAVTTMIKTNRSTAMLFFRFVSSVQNPKGSNIPAEQ